jgi:hypothetical protein
MTCTQPQAAVPDVAAAPKVRPEACRTRRGEKGKVAP